MDVRAVPADEEPAASLLEAMRLLLTEVNDGLDPSSPEMPPRTSTSLSDRAVEVKRMYFVPSARGRRVPRALLARLASEARGRGFAVARLETGPANRRPSGCTGEAGYMEIGSFNANPVASFWGEKRL